MNWLNILCMFRMRLRSSIASHFLLCCTKQLRNLECPSFSEAPGACAPLVLGSVLQPHWASACSSHAQCFLPSQSLSHWASPCLDTLLSPCQCPPPPPPWLSLHFHPSSRAQFKASYPWEDFPDPWTRSHLPAIHMVSVTGLLLLSAYHGGYFVCSHLIMWFTVCLIH